MICGFRLKNEEEEGIISKRKEEEIIDLAMALRRRVDRIGHKKTIFNLQRLFIAEETLTSYNTTFAINHGYYCPE